MEKIVFTKFVANTIQENPEWFADTVLAMQGGLSEALEEERAKTATLAYHFSTLIDAAPKQTEKVKPIIQKGLKILLGFFETAPIAETVKKYIVEQGDD